MLHLTAARLALRWSQARLASAARIAASDLSKIERELLKPYPKQIERLGAALGVEPSHLLDEVELLVVAHDAGVRP